MQLDRAGYFYQCSMLPGCSCFRRHFLSFLTLSDWSDLFWLTLWSDACANLNSFPFRLQPVWIYWPKFQTHSVSIRDDRNQQEIMNQTRAGKEKCLSSAPFPFALFRFWFWAAGHQVCHFINMQRRAPPQSCNKTCSPIVYSRHFPCLHSTRPAELSQEAQVAVSKWRCIRRESNFSLMFYPEFMKLT